MAVKLILISWTILAGVDCSDHEVNIKILLNQVVMAGQLSEMQRNPLLAQMTDEVAKFSFTR